MTEIVYFYNTKKSPVAYNGIYVINKDCVF